MLRIEYIIFFNDLMQILQQYSNKYDDYFLKRFRRLDNMLKLFKSIS